LKKSKRQDQHREAGEHRSGNVRAAMHDRIIELVPAVDAEEKEDAEDAQQIEDALGEHRAESFGETNVSAAGEKRRAGNVAGANRQNRREHVAHRVREKCRIKRGRIARAKQNTPAKCAKNQGRSVHEKAHREPGHVRRQQDPPDIAEVALPKKQAEKDNRQQDD